MKVTLAWILDCISRKLKQESEFILYTIKKENN